jgi:MOSC domain-containing protein YiiM
MGKVIGLAIKHTQKLPLELADVVDVTERGIVGNVEQSADRRITLLAREQWENALVELGQELPWTTRRANVLVEGVDLASCMGKSLQVGGIVLKIRGETKPCGFMEAACTGLYDALVPDCRGGVYGSVEEAGKIAIGDTVALVDGSEV